MSTEGLVKNTSLQSTHHGVQVDWYAPWGYGAPSDGADATNFFDFYLGYEAVEAGIFYYAQKGWVIFLNCACWADTREDPASPTDPNWEGWWEKPISITPGQKYNMKLKHNDDYSASFYFNGVEMFRGKVPTELKWDEENRIPKTGGQVKMVHGKWDDLGKVYYAGGSYANPKLLRNSGANGTWVDWTPTGWGYGYSASGDTEKFVVHRQFPLKTDYNYPI